MPMQHTLQLSTSYTYVATFCASLPGGYKTNTVIAESYRTLQDLQHSICFDQLGVK